MVMEQVAWPPRWPRTTVMLTGCAPLGSCTVLCQGSVACDAVPSGVPDQVMSAVPWPSTAKVMPCLATLSVWLGEGLQPARNRMTVTPASAVEVGGHLRIDVDIGPLPIRGTGYLEYR